MKGLQTILLTDKWHLNNKPQRLSKDLKIKAK